MGYIEQYQTHVDISLVIVNFLFRFAPHVLRSLLSVISNEQSGVSIYMQQLLQR